MRRLFLALSPLAASLLFWAAEGQGAPPVRSTSADSAGAAKQNLLLAAQARAPLGRRSLIQHDDEESADKPPLAVDRETVRRLETATELIEKKDYAQGFRQLQRVLDHPEDSWVEPAAGESDHFQSARREATDQIARLPAAARESYETEFGQVARRMLDDAAVRGDRAAIEEVVRRFFHTRAGYQAAYLLANRLLDDGFPLTAALQFDRLRTSPGAGFFEPMLSLKAAYCWQRSGLPDKSRAILTPLKPRLQREKIKIGGRNAILFKGEGDPLDRLSAIMGGTAPPRTFPSPDWPLEGGTPDRDAESIPALPLGDPVWSQSVIRDREIGDKSRLEMFEATLKAYTDELEDRGALTAPVAIPLVVGHTAVFRTLARLRACDVRTGEPLWDFVEPDRQYVILAGPRPASRLGRRIPVSTESPEQDDLRLFLNARSYLDSTYGTISSDGQRVFAILDSGFVGQGDEMKPSPQAELGGPPSYNVLAGIDLASGRFLWEIGGSRSDRAREFAGTFFLGCGLPVGNSLYCLGERDGEITLYELDVATGKATWSQRIVLPAGRLPHFPLRRLAGGSPSLSGGLLICPTTAGTLVACDPALRTLAWEYRYRINLSDELPKPRDWVSDSLMLLRDLHDDSNRWLDSSPIIAEGRVILTPRDSKELHCVNLADGALRWKRERGEGLFVGCIDDGMVVVVGRSGLEALRVSDGSPIWTQSVALPTPSGRGYRTGRLYHLPLSSGELATIDLRHGRVVARSKFPKNCGPGNFVAAAGTVVLQSAAAVRGFRPTSKREQEIVAALKQKPDDAAALAERGELRLHRGQTQAGLDDLYESVRLRRDERTQWILVGAVLGDLQVDFAKNREAAKRIEPLIVDPSQQFEFRQLMAGRFEESGDLAAAFEQKLRLAQDASQGTALVSVDESLASQPAYLVAPDLGKLRAKADSNVRAQLDKRIDDWVRRLVNSKSVPQLASALATLRELPQELALRESFVQTLSASNDVKSSKVKSPEKPAADPNGHHSTANGLSAPQRAQLYRQLTLLHGAKQQQQAGTATAQLARLLIDEGREGDALNVLSELEGNFANVICSPGRTGAQVALECRKEAAVKEELARLAPWPRTKLTIHRQDAVRPVHAISVLPVDRRAGSLFRHWHFELQDGRAASFTLVAIDGLGAERWRLYLDAEKLGSDMPGDSPIAVRLNGSLIQLVLHRRIAMFEALNANEPPRLLWVRPLFDAQWSEENQLRSEVGMTGLLTDDFVFYQFGPKLRCADPVTGQLIWERRNLPANFILQGDQDYVIALNRNEPAEPSGAVLGSPTGMQVSKGAFGISGPLYGDWKGRCVLRTTVQSTRLSLAFTDLVEHKPVWTLDYAMPASWVPIDEDEFAILDNDSRLHIHSLETGKKIVVAQIERSGSPAIRRIGERYLIIGQNASLRLPYTRQIARKPLSAKIWAIDRKTGKTDFTAEIPPMQFPIDVPTGSPVLALARTINPSLGEAVLTLLDLRTGEKIYEDRETVSDRIAVQLEPGAHRLTITTEKSRLEITPSDTPLKVAMTGAGVFKQDPGSPGSNVKIVIKKVTEETDKKYSPAGPAPPKAASPRP